ncbi:thioredoxin family protein [Pedobacter xixiisoli]|uniref:Thioredoxin-like n=1 Tax=Pedobacter xixiisoli TaxID=1476464 RepID=A0A286ADQ8_9SPHI|nr:thioredoxin family protein [Pedobacter xixiisoli]SOD20039.1 Thioredoxin-like [Pedobacter xixiisoli]
MRKRLLAACLLLVTLSVNAAEIKFLENPTWTSVLEKAKKENKIIFLDAYATWCGPCKQMDAETYTNQAVADFYNANFINVKYDMEKGEGAMLADRYYVSAYPNLVFISPDGVMLHKGVGFIAANEFLTLAKTAKNPETQYYTLKKGALKLSNAQFLKFAKQAVDLQDEDFGHISKDFLAAKPDILGDSDLIDLIMNYAFALPKEKDLTYFSTSKSKILREGKYTEDDFEERLVSLAIQFALSEEVQVTEEMDFEAIEKILDKYVPERSFFVYNYFKTQYFLENKETDQALTSFNEILEHPDKAGYQQVCNAMMGFGPILFEEGKLDTYLAKFNAIPVPAKDKEVAYLKDFVNAIIFIKTKQTAKFKETANAMLASATTPEDVKKDLKLALQNMGAN